MEKTAVTFPVDKDTFRDFIRAILGKPQTLNRVIFGRFELSLDNIIGIFEIIDQRIHQQNKSGLIQFCTKIIYSDNSSRLLSSLDELKTFSEHRDVFPISVHLEISYLVSFIDESRPGGFGKPEKQEINLSIVASGLHSIKMLNMVANRYVPIESEGYFEITIKHTAISWGADIDSLLTNSIKAHIRKESKIQKLIRSHSDTIGFLIGGVLFFTSILVSIIRAFQTEKYSKDVINKLFSSLPKDPILEINTKMDFIIRNFSNYVGLNQDLLTILFLILSLFLSIALGVWVSIAAENTPSSFLLLNTASENNKKDLDKKYNLKWGSLFTSFFVSIVTGICSNYIFMYLCNLKTFK
jgi:hypothetical protein